MKIFTFFGDRLTGGCFYFGANNLCVYPGTNVVLCEGEAEAVEEAAHSMME